MSEIAMHTAQLISMLPESDQNLAYELVKKLVLAWDPDFTKVTADEAARIEAAEKSGYVNNSDIDWDNLQSMNL